MSAELDQCFSQFCNVIAYLIQHEIYSCFLFLSSYYKNITLKLKCHYVFIIHGIYQLGIEEVRLI